MYEDEYRTWLKDSVMVYTLKCVQQLYNNNNSIVKAGWKLLS